MKKTKLISLLLVLVLLSSMALVGCGDKGDVKPEDAVDTSGNVNEEDPQENPQEEPSDSGEEKLADKQVLRVNLMSEPPCLDPQLSTDTTSSEILNDILEGIIRMDQDGVPKEGSGMAKSWDISEDGTVYTFHLRDAMWSDGVPVTAEQFEFAWKRVLDPAVASTYAFMAYDIVNAQAYNTGEITDPEEVGVEATDENTLVVTLEKPNPIFLSKLQHSTFFPARPDMIDELGAEYASEARYTPSCGPFKVTEWQHENSLTIEKNDLYWDADAVKLDKVEFAMINNSNSRIGMYETGQLDYEYVPGNFIEKYQGQFQIITEAASGYYFFNTENKVGSNSDIRKAFRRAIDQQKVYDAMTKGVSRAAYGWVPPGMAGYDGKTFREIAGDKLFTDLGNGATSEEVKAQFEKGLSELGITREDVSKEITFLTGDGDRNLQYGEIYQQMWDEVLGVKIGLEQATWKVRLARWDSGDFVYSSSGWSGDYNDALTFLEMFLSESGQNDTNWTSEEFDAYVHQAMDSYDQKERIDAMVEAEKILVQEEAAIQPRVYATQALLERPYVKGMIRLPLQVTNGKKWAYILEH